MKKLFIILGLLAITTLCSATVINVPADYNNIQAGIDAATEYDTVLVDTGTYMENINFNGKNITVASKFLTTQDTSYISQTVIDGDSSGSVVTFNSGEDSTAVLTGFKITNGYANFGGGIYCWNSSSSLDNVTITNNTAGYGGGGIYCYNESSPSLENVTISNNTADGAGGGIYCWNSNPSLENVTISNNTANYGGGIYCSYYSSPSLENVTISNNTADWGGGISCYNESSPSLENVTISNNTADYGGGIYCFDNSSPSLEDVTITNNTAGDYGGGIYCGNNSSPSFSSENRCNIYFNSISNSKGYGADIFTMDCDTIDVIVDTFTVMTPTDYYASPIDNFTFDILHGVQNTLINSDLYVSADGDNSNTGTNTDEPLRTIKYALSRIYTDSLNQNTIHLESGIYSSSTNGEEFPLKWSSYVTLEGSSESETILDADNTNGVMEFHSVNNATINNITLKNGDAYVGGGIYCRHNSSPSLMNVTISNNTAGDYGGGISCSNSNLSLVNVTISNNTAGYSGGGIYCSSSSPSLENVTISNNTAGDYGGGIYCGNNSSPSLVNCILWNNSPQEVYFWYFQDPNSITISYSDIEGGEAGIVTNNNGTAYWEEGNIDLNPLFVDPTNGDYHLTENSPCIDAGTPDTTGLNLPPWDLDGNIRIWDGDGDGIAQIDMGAYEFDAPSCAINDEQQHIEKIRLVSYPNPVNSSSDNLNIKFSLPKPDKVKIRIFNTKGQLVSTVLEQQLNSGEHIIPHSLKDVSNGIYFIKLEVDGEKSYVRKLLKLD